jgi:hypothetical protein
VYVFVCVKVYEVKRELRFDGFGFRLSLSYLEMAGTQLGNVGTGRGKSEMSLAGVDHIVDS